LKIINKAGVRKDLIESEKVIKSPQSKDLKDFTENKS
jgi:hypothetical protein